MISFVEQNKITQKRANSCVKHDEHCSICGIGFNVVDSNLEGGAPVYVEYTYEQRQDVCYPEIDHMRCSRCLDDKIVPNDCFKWSTPEILARIFSLQQNISHASQCSSLRHQEEPVAKKQKIIRDPNLGDKFLIWGGKSGWLGEQLRDLCEEQKLNYHCAASRIENREEVEKELEFHKPTHVLMAAGLTGRPTVDYLEDHKDEGIRTNVIGVLNVVDLCAKRGIHVTNFATGCIFKYDEAHPIGGKGFTEEDTPNFSGSFYSHTKAMVENLLSNYDNCLTLRIRMPISADLHHRNFVTKILNYAKVVNIPNSMTTLDDMLPIALKASQQKLTGILNFCNPGAISHNEILTMYREYIDPAFAWENFSEAECNAILKAGRSNNTLSSEKLLKLFPEVPEIHEACKNAFIKMAATVKSQGKENLIAKKWKFPQTK